MRFQFYLLFIGMYVLVGCGGASDVVQQPTGSISVTERLGSKSITPTGVVNGVVSYTEGGVTKSLLLSTPFTSYLPTAGPVNVAVVESGSQLLRGNYSRTKMMFINPIAPSSQIFDTSDVVGRIIDASGQLLQDIGLVADQPFIFVVGPVDLEVASSVGGGSTATFSNVKYHISGKPMLVSGRVVAPFPTSISGKLPQPGQVLGVSAITMTFDSAYNGHLVSLLLGINRSIVLKQERAIANGTVTFNLDAGLSNRYYTPVNSVDSMIISVK